MAKRKNRPVNHRQIARHKCKDCGVNVIKIGEYYMVSPQIWQDKLRLTWADNLCIGCLEKRLGRKLRQNDFITWPENPGGYANSERYSRRVLGDQLFAISKLKPGEPLPRGWKWKKVGGRWHATDGSTFIGQERGRVRFVSKTKSPSRGRWCVDWR
jgi:hypothetical protein